MAASKYSTGGYDVILMSSTPERFRCPFCKKLMKDAVQTFRGERACAQCYETAKGYKVLLFYNFTSKICLQSI